MKSIQELLEAVNKCMIVDGLNLKLDRALLAKHLPNKKQLSIVTSAMDGDRPTIIPYRGRFCMMDHIDLPFAQNHTDEVVHGTIHMGVVYDPDGKAVLIVAAGGVVWEEKHPA